MKASRASNGRHHAAVPAFRILLALTLLTEASRGEYVAGEQIATSSHAPRAYAFAEEATTALPTAAPTPFMREHSCPDQSNPPVGTPHVRSLPGARKGRIRIFSCHSTTAHDFCVLNLNTLHFLVCLCLQVLTEDEMSLTVNPSAGVDLACKQSLGAGKGGEGRGYIWRAH